MIKVLCEKCKWKGTIFPHVRGRDECETCGGKGYTEHEGSSEDLELAASVKAAFKCNKDKETILFINSEWCGQEIDTADAEVNCEAGLLEWYRNINQ